MTPPSRPQSQSLHRCQWCKEWGRPVSGVCGKCGEPYIAVPNEGPPRVTNPEACADGLD